MSKVLTVLIGTLFVIGGAMAQTAKDPAKDPHASKPAAGSTGNAKPSMDTSKPPTHPTTAASSPENAKPSTVDTTKPPTHPAQPSSSSSKAPADQSRGSPAKS